MSMRLSRTVPWGRSMQEYELMFDLSESDRMGRMLGCGDGPASFNAEMTARGCSVISCDPIYDLSPANIEEQFEAGVEPIMSQVRAHRENYVWSYHRDPEALLNCRKAVMRRFITDYPTGLAQGRYAACELPQLPFKGQEFDLALCSHLLFLYSKLFSLTFHIESVLELCRIAKEVRIFPLTDLSCEPSPYVAPVELAVRELGWRTQIMKVNYQVQRNGNEMLRIWK